MNRSVLIRPACAALVMMVAACHHAATVVPSPAPVAVKPNADSIAAAQAARDRIAAARRDSIARANAARDAEARAEADRRAREAAAAVARGALTARIYFEYQRDELRGDAVAALDAKVSVLRAHPELRIRIEGNADDRGSDEYNLALGERRSAAARRYLVERGIPETRIDVVSFGEERPVCHDEAESCWHQNRRDEFTIVAGAQSLNAIGKAPGGN